MKHQFEFISADGQSADYRHIPTGARLSLKNDGVFSLDLTAAMLDAFNAWRMLKYIEDIGTMQANHARYGYEDPAQIARDYPAPRPARGWIYRDGQRRDISTKCN